MTFSLEPARTALACFLVAVPGYDSALQSEKVPDLQIGTYLCVLKVNPED